MLSFNELKLGGVLSIDNQPYQITKTQHSKIARGGAVLRTKLKNLINGSVLEKTFKSSDQVEEADLQRTKANFMYSEGDDFFFMDNTSYEQFTLNRQAIGDISGYVKEGEDIEILNYNDKPVSIFLPPKIELKVTSAPPGIKGDSAGNVTKRVTLETGLIVDAPLFVKEGDTLRINTQTGQYVERV